MRISDWSSDVCSSDLQPFGQDVLILLLREIDFHPTVHHAQLFGVHRSVHRRSQPVVRFQLGTVPECAMQDRQCPQTLGYTVDAEMIGARSEEHTSELQSLMRISYAVFCLKKKKNYTP